MLRPPKILTPLPTVGTSQRLRYPARLPAVLSSAWKAQDETIGVFFTNISNKEMSFECELSTDEERESETAAKYMLLAVSEDGESEVLETFSKGKIHLKGNIDAHDIVFYRLVPKAAEK
jgi:hypothetical protein